MVCRREARGRKIGWETASGVRMEVAGMETKGMNGGMDGMEGPQRYRERIDSDKMQQRSQGRV